MKRAYGLVKNITAGCGVVVPFLSGSISSACKFVNLHLYQVSVNLSMDKQIHYCKVPTYSALMYALGCTL